LNEEYQKLVMKSPEGKPSMLMGFIQKQTGPLMDKVNQFSGESKHGQICRARRSS
jgi:hypothetical protein